MRTPHSILVAAVAALMLLIPAAGAAQDQNAKAPAAGKAKPHKSRLADRNRDRIPDRWERKYRLSLRVNQASRDQDRDHMRNLMEFRTGSNPRDDDSDDDGVKDEDENAGEVISFENGVLTIGLAGGRTLDGLVNDQTEIDCKPAAQPSSPPADQQPVVGTTSDRHGGDDGDSEAGDGGGGDHSGPGSPGSGPGSGDHGDDDPGDDDHGDDHHGDDDHGGMGPDDDEVPCSTAELVPGAFVHEAEAEVTADGLVFSEIELMTPVAPPTQSR